MSATRSLSLPPPEREKGFTMIHYVILSLLSLSLTMTPFITFLSLCSLMLISFYQTISCSLSSLSHASLVYPTFRQLNTLSPPPLLLIIGHCLPPMTESQVGVTNLCLSTVGDLAVNLYFMKEHSVLASER